MTLRRAWCCFLFALYSHPKARFTMWFNLTLTHWGRVTHICVVNLTIIGSDNGLSPGRRQARIWTNAGILLIGPLGTNFIEILIGIQTFSFKKMHMKMSSAKWRPFCLDLNVLITVWISKYTHYNVWGEMTYPLIYASLNKPSLVQIMACRLDGAKPLSEPMLGYC